MSSIKSIRAREILSSGSAPSIEVECILESGASGKASVPFGVSAGSHEASVILDGDKERFRGKGMLKAAGIVNNTISKLLIGEDAFSQRKIDGKMIKADGTENKQKLGGNSILGASLAVARASANERKRPLYMHIRDA
ncbi:phosphopyruvate hydratase, partial [Candidatus Woesearchaeota archaeon]|nr:phosphopyruvate hydratase [Candidatus Woesearchaeota archaeon]